MSKKDVRDRLIRIFISSLLKEEFSQNERRAVVNILRSPDFGFDFSEIVGTVYSAIEGHGAWSQVILSAEKSESERENRSNSPEELLDEIMQIAKRKRLSKAALLNILNKVDSNVANNLSTESSITRIVETFFLHSSQEQRYELFNLLAGEKRDDEYLKGISERHNR
ncbi:MULTISPECIES: hypothetical protein [unclassified Burkholderia]|uniref:hypothetical protein n=1 Tax=unclassified Burkholderia TaxID=2613784 RepID=UPI002AB0DEAA|nr:MULTISPECIES: hypothetical protein [unclassified Burkholderia]